MNPTCNIEDILTAARGGQKIELIKMFRQESGKGLKDSKDAIEACQISGSTRYNEYKLVNVFYEASGYSPRYRSHVYEPEMYDKEKFLADISNAIDAGKAMKCYDMLEAALIFLQNVKEQGGIDELARAREAFVNKI